MGGGSWGADRVDVLAYDERVPLDDGDPEHEQAISIATWVVVAVVLGYGFLEGTMLFSVAGAMGIVAVRVLLLDAEREVRTRYRAVHAGRGAEIVRAHEHEARKRSRMRTALLGLLVGFVFVYALVQGSLLAGVVASGLVAGVGHVVGGQSDHLVPRLVEEGIDRERAGALFELVDDSTTGPAGASDESVDVAGR